jgi:hypothetical protein
MARNFNVKDTNLTAQIRDGQAPVKCRGHGGVEVQRNCCCIPAASCLSISMRAAYSHGATSIT